MHDMKIKNIKWLIELLHFYNNNNNNNNTIRVLPSSMTTSSTMKPKPIP